MVYTPENPMKDTIGQLDKERKILREREDLKYLGRMFAAEHY